MSCILLTAPPNVGHISVTHAGGSRNECPLPEHAKSLFILAQVMDVCMKSLDVENRAVKHLWGRSITHEAADTYFSSMGLDEKFINEFPPANCLSRILTVRFATIEKQAPYFFFLTEQNKNIIPWFPTSFTQLPLLMFTQLNLLGF